jgi:hypothetical protein
MFFCASSLSVRTVFLNRIRIRWIPGSGSRRRKISLKRKKFKTDDPKLFCTNMYYFDCNHILGDKLGINCLMHVKFAFCVSSAKLWPHFNPDPDMLSSKRLNPDPYPDPHIINVDTKQWVRIQTYSIFFYYVWYPKARRILFLSETCCYSI